MPLEKKMFGSERNDPRCGPHLLILVGQGRRHILRLDLRTFQLDEH